MVDIRMDKKNRIRDRLMSERLRELCTQLRGDNGKKYTIF